MSETNIETVRTLLNAIAGQDDTTAVQQLAPGFRQHDSHLGDGAEGVREYITGSPREQLALSVVRVLADGSYVFVHLKAPDGPHIFSVYRLQDGLVAEHWGFATPDAPANRSGHTQLDGPTEPAHLSNTQNNKAFMRRY